MMPPKKPGIPGTYETFADVKYESHFASPDALISVLELPQKLFHNGPSTSVLSQATVPLGQV